MPIVNITDLNDVQNFFNCVKANGFSEFNKIENTFGEKISLMQVGFNNKIIWFNNLPEFNVPEMTGYSMGIDSIQIILDFILENRPKNIVELGSGLSTVVFSGLIDNFLEETSLISIDGESKYQEELIPFLNQFKNYKEQKVKLFEGKLTDIKIDNMNFKWFNPEVIQSLPKIIDLLIVDGPQYYLNDIARFPAYELLKPKLAKNCVIFLDDGFRDQEQKIKKMWNKSNKFNIEEYNCLEGLIKFS
jgi:Methyltransferase domain